MTPSPPPKILPALVFTILLSSLHSVVVTHPTRAFAAEAPGAFETISVEAQVATSTGLGSFTDYWKPSAGGWFEVSTPFYAGIVETGVHVFGHDAVSPAVPEFDSVYLYLGWAYEWRLPWRLAWSAGANTGVFNMMFDDDLLPEARRNESELGFAAETRVRCSVAQGWSILVSGEYRKILTDRPVEYVFIGTGLGYTFGTPRWLREFLE